jgi:hypothetical protein
MIEVKNSKRVSDHLLLHILKDVFALGLVLRASALLVCLGVHIVMDVLIILLGLVTGTPEFKLLATGPVTGTKNTH